MKKFFAIFFATLFIAGFCFSQTTVNVNGFGQVQALIEQGGGNQDFRVNRIRLNIFGDVAEKVSYRIQLEEGSLTYPGPGNRDNLVDFYADLKYIKGATIRVGQFVQPIGMELPLSPYALETINYSSIVSKGYSTRDRGVMIFGSPTENIDYQLALINGEGLNTNDTNEQKDWVGKVKVKIIPELSLALSHYYQPETPTAKKMTSTGAELDLKVNNLRFCGEYMMGKQTGGVKTADYYLHLSYKVTPEWQLVLRYNVSDPNTKTSGDLGTAGGEETTTIGVNYDFEKNARLQINYVIPRGKDNNKLIAQLGVKF